MMKHQNLITATIDVLNDLREYQPLTLRQVFYQLVSRLILDNTLKNYKLLSDTLKKARMQGLVPWDAIEDRTREFHFLMGHSDISMFLRQELEQLFSGYRRHLLQDQKYYIEVWIEKDALSSIFKKVCHEHTVSLVISKGFASISFLKDYADRATIAKQQNLQPVILYFSDFDASGLDMMPACRKNLMELGLTDIIFERCALTKEQIHYYKLPVSLSAIKEKDSRAKKHIERHGMLAVELDALHPETLTRIIEDSVFKYVNSDGYIQQYRIFKDELDFLENLKQKVTHYITTTIQEV
ncbi:MAG: hypothetical protein N2738_04340 [Thermodesulfovibrionales bacterium]|nr:hypothetical protein [Thermodesulfovibrionales bacterium]